MKSLMTLQDHPKAMLAAIAMLALAGCKETPQAPADPVQRLIHERLAGDEGVTIAAPEVAGSWNARGAREVENTADGLRLVWGGSPAVMTLSGTIRAEDYASFVVRMRIDGNDKEGAAAAVLRWRTRLDPEAREESSHSVPVFRDGVYHTYTFPLRESGGTWLDEVTELEFIPCDRPGNVDIQQMELASERATTPVRLTIAGETHEAVFGSQVPWTFRVPANGLFETYVGMPPLAWDREEGDGVTFRVTLARNRQEDVELAEERFDPLTREADRAWRAVQADLTDYAGKEVTLRLTVEHHETMMGDYAYWGSPTVFARETAAEDVPVILISNDTLRADRLGCYGHDRETSPHLDAFSRDAVVFENAMCTAPWTLPSHMTMLTGLYPTRHKVSHTINLRESIETMPELLGRAGYLSAAYTGVHGYLNPDYGFSHGFDIYNTPAEFRTIEATGPMVADWLDRHDRGRFLLFFHNFDIHSKPPNPDAEDPYFKLPYHLPSKELRYFATTMPVPPLLQFGDPNVPTGTALLEAACYDGLKIDAQSIRYMLALYDDGIRYVDEHLGAFFEDLKARDLYDRSLIIVTSDHGEEFFEHRRYLHTQIHEECQRVPLLVKFPANAHGGLRYEPVVSLVDLLPTVTDVVGLEAELEVDGQSLLALIEEEETPVGRAFGQHYNQKTIRTDAWRLFSYGTDAPPLLYNIAADVRAIRALRGAHETEAAALEAELAAFFESDRAGWNIEFESLADHGTTKLELELEFDSPVGDVQLLRTANSESADFDRFERIDGGRKVKAALTLFGADRDSLVLLPTGGNQRVRVRILADKEIAVDVGKRGQFRSRGIQGVLDASEEDFPRPVDLPARLMPSPRMRLWFEEPAAALPPAAALSDEERQELEALGYLTQ